MKVTRDHVLILLAFYLGYFVGGVAQSFALKNDYEQTVKYLRKLGYRGEVCEKIK